MPRVSFGLPKVYAVALALLSPAYGSLYYVTDGNTIAATQNVYVIDTETATAIDSFTTYSGAYPIAILNNRLRIAHISGSDLVREYNPDGSINTTFPASTPGFSALDGTTNGTNNFLVSFGQIQDQVYRTNLTFGAAVSLFNLPDALSPPGPPNTHQSGRGIAYDPVHNSLWVSLDDTRLLEYSLTSNTIVFISAQHQFSPDGFPRGNRLSALAYDATTDSFFGLDIGRGPADYLVQFDRTGTFISYRFLIANGILPVNGSGAHVNNIYGGEIIATPASEPGVPEPATFVMMAGGLAILVVVRGRRRNKRLGHE